ncbi:hypothetical protein AB4549_01650 [Vibrio breoganii]
MQKKLKGYKTELISKVMMDREVFNSDIIQAVVLQFKLPFVVFVPDGLNTESSQTTMDPIAVVQDKVAGELRFLKRINKDQESWGLTIASEDIFGEFSYSVGKLVIQSSDDQNHPLNEQVCDGAGEVDPDKVVQLATKLISKFVDSYRTIYGQSKDWIPDINAARLSPWHNMSAVDFSGKTVWSMGVYDFRGTGNMLGMDLDSESLSKLQALCAQSEREDLAKKYITLANRHRKLRDYQSFCVFSVIAMEHWVFREVRNALYRQGLPEKQVEESFYETNKRGVKKNIAREEAIKLVTGDKNFKNDSRYTDFIDTVVFKRDSIVHGRKVELSEDDANQIINIITKYQDMLNSLFQKGT